MQAARSSTAVLDVEPPDALRNDDANLSTLLGGIVSDLQQLMEDHLQLLKLEVQDDLQKSRNAMIPMAIGGVLILAACMLMLATLVGWLAWLRPDIPWFSWSGLLALVVACTGGILLVIARRRWTFVHPLPEKTLRQVKRTIQSINNQVNTESP